MRELARAVFFQKKASDAFNALRKAYQIDPRKSQLPELALAALYAEFGDTHNAEVWIKIAIARGADELPARLLLARWAVGNADWDGALRNAERALAIEPKSLEANVIRGQIALHSKEYKTAQRYFECAEKVSPEDCAARCGLALALCEQDEEATKARALTFSKANFEKYPKSVDAAVTHGRVLYRLGRVEEADNVIRQVDIAGADISPDMAYYIACIAADRGRKDEAAEMIRRALRDMPGSMKRETVALLEKLFADPKQGELQPGDTVIVVARNTGDRNFGGTLVGFACFPGGTRLKVAKVDGDYVFVDAGKERQAMIHRKSVAKLH
jgi:lipopolysaccharide biosynthesis regulator YciM